MLRAHTCPSSRLPGTQMPTPQPDKLQHVGIKANTQVRLNWREGKGPRPFHQWNIRENDFKKPNLLAITP